MAVSVDILAVPQRWLAAATFRCLPDGFATAVGDAFMRINEALIAAGVDLGETEVIAYRRTDAGYDGCVGYDVPEEFAATDAITPFSLPAGEVGRIRFGDDDIEEPLDELETGILAEGREVDPEAPLWEEHRKDPATTTIFWPLLPAA